MEDRKIEQKIVIALKKSGADLIELFSEIIKNDLFLKIAKQGPLYDELLGCVEVQYKEATLMYVERDLEYERYSKERQELLQEKIDQLSHLSHCGKSGCLNCAIPSYGIKSALYSMYYFYLTQIAKKKLKSSLKDKI